MSVYFIPLTCLLLGLGAGVHLHGGDLPKTRFGRSFGQLPLVFEPGAGQDESQGDAQVNFVSRGRGYSFYLASNEAVLIFQNSKMETRAEIATFKDGRIPKPEHRAPSLLHLRLMGANLSPRVAGLEELPGKSNYLIGNDPRKWRTNVPNFARVIYQNVYPGIDLIYYGWQGELECDFALAPGADPGAISLRIDVQDFEASPEALEHHKGDPIGIDTRGELVVKTRGGEVRFRKPLVYQIVGADPGVPPDRREGQSRRTAPTEVGGRRYLDGRFVLKGGHVVGFALASYDATKPLVIDPVLSYATYLGGTNSDLASGIAVDSSGNAYITGYTLSTNFPTTIGALRTAFGGGASYGDVFITKLNATGSSLVYSTYLGGSNDDVGVGVAVDTSVNAYVTGYTRSSDFPTTSGAFRKTIGGGTCGQSPSTFPCGDAFVVKLNSSGNALVYSTYIGGGLDDWGLAIALDALSNAYVTGYAESTDFPTTSGAFETSFAGGTCGGSPCAAVFATKLTADGSSPVYSTYFGGNGGRGFAIAVDGLGSAYVTGSTDSLSFPTTLGAIQTASGENGDAFVAKLKPAGSGLIYSTYLGGTGGDVGTGIALDSSGNAYVTGLTSSANFPVTSGAFQATCGGCAKGFHDAFVTKLNGTGSGLGYSTFLGGSSEDLAYGVAVDSSGDAYVTGRTASPDFPTSSPFQSACSGGCTSGLSDAFIAELNAAGSALLYSTYLGGRGNDSAYAIALDSANNAYITGSTTSSDLPTTTGAFQRNLAGTADTFVAKIAPSNAPAVTMSNASLTFANQVIGTTGSAQTVTLQNAGSAALSISSITTSGDFSETNTCGTSLTAGATCTISVTFTPTTLGTRTGAVTISDNAASSPQTISLSGVGIDNPVATLSATQVNFGNQLVGTPSSVQTVSLANTGTSSLDITSIATSGDFSQTNTCGGSVAAGANCAISITFTPTATGNRAGAISITDNAPGSPQVISLSGTGVAPAITLTASSLSFGSQLVGTSSAAQTVTLTNSGTATLSISSLVISGDFAQTNTCGTSVATGANCVISVTFKPTATGTRTGVVTITDNASSSPQAINLNGTGVAPAVTLSASSLAYGNQLVGTTSAAQLVTLTNSGTATLAFISMAVSGDFAQANTCGTSVVAGANCVISMTFTPTVTGARTGNVTIADNASGSPQAISLTGTGIAPAVTLSAISLSFGNQALGTTSPGQTVTLTNSGTATLSISSLVISGDFAQTNTCGTSVATGANCVISVTFKPTATGTRTGVVTITDNASSSPQAINLNGTGVAPAVTLSASSLAYGNQLVGTTSAAQLVTLTNSGTATLTFNSMAVSGDFAQANTCGASVVAGANCVISVTFTPTATGPRTGNVTIADNASGSPQVITLTGTGTAPALSLSATSLSLGEQGVGTVSTAQTLTLSNTGSATLSIGSITISGDFVRTNTCATSIAPGSSCPISVNFQPSAIGARSGTLTISDNAPGSPHTVALSGTGVVAYQLTTSKSSATVIRGADSASFAISASTRFGFGASISLACPANSQANCSFSPSSIVPGQMSTLTVSNLKAVPAGALPFTIAGSSGVQSSSLALTVFVADFSLSVSPTESSMAAGQTSTYDLTLTPLAGFSREVLLTCSGMPPRSNCSISPSSASLDGSGALKATATITTTGRSGAARPRIAPGALSLPSPVGRVVFLILLAGALLGWLLGWAGPKGPSPALCRTPVCPKRLCRVIGIVTLFALVAMSSSACGGGGGGSLVASLPSGTPAGTYTITLTGTYNDTAGATPVSLTHSATVILVVN